MTLSSERHTVQKPFLRYAEEAGWTYLPPEEALCLRSEESMFVVCSRLMNEENFKEESHA